MPSNEKDEITGGILSHLIREGDIKISIVAPLDTSIRDYILLTHKELFGDKLFMRGIYITLGGSIGFAGGTLLAGNNWWGVIIAGALTFFIASIFVSRYTSTIAITRISGTLPVHFEFLWDAQVIAIRFPKTGKIVDSRTTSRWQDTIQELVINHSDA